MQNCIHNESSQQLKIMISSSQFILLIESNHTVIMGQSESTDHFIANRWQLIEEHADFSLVRDKNGREGEERQITASRRDDPRIELGIYQLRKTTPHPIVRIYGAEYKKSEQICNSSLFLRVITQHLYIIFGQPLQLEMPELLFLMAEAVEGYQFLHQKVGCFRILPQMMGLTSEGQLRVWMHTNFLYNRPQMPKKSIPIVCREEKSNAEQAFMIGQIVDVFKKISKSCPIPPGIVDLAQKKSNFTAFKAQIFSIQNYLRVQSVRRVDLLRLRR